MGARIILSAVVLLGATAARAQDQPASSDSNDGSTAAAQKGAMLVLDIRPLDGVDLSKTRLLSDLLVNHLRRTGKYKVLSQSDVKSIVGVDQQAQLMGCDDESCMAQLAGALDAPWLVTGNLGWLGGGLMLTLKLLDSQQAELKNQLSQQLPGDEDQLPRSMEEVAYELVGMTAPALPAWYTKWWVWTIAGVVVAAGITTGLIVGLQPTVASGNLGQVTF